MKVKIISFGYKHNNTIDGLNLLYDVRFLTNPYWDESLRFFTGQDKQVQDYIFKTKEGKEFIENLKNVISSSLNEWKNTKRSEKYIIGFGCTGGEHRSVAVAEVIYNFIKNVYDVELEHLDLDKREKKGKSILESNENYKPKVLCFGGGSGLSTLLKGLRQFPVDITAVVTVADDGGSTGVLREQFDMPAPGDLRRVLLALSDNESLYDELFNFRFTTDSELKNHTVGNIVIAALYGMAGNNFIDAINNLSSMLNVKGKVLPISDELVTLACNYKDGSKAVGEVNIPNKDKEISNVFYNNKVTVNKSVVKEILQADVIVFSSGSLFTSLLPNLLFEEVVSAIERSKAKTIYVSNLTTQPGETDGFTLNDHIKAIEDVIGEGAIDTVIANNNFDIPKDILEKYNEEGQKLLKPDNLEKDSILEKFITISDNHHIRHDTKKIGYHIFSIAFNEICK